MSRRRDADSVVEVCKVCATQAGGVCSSDAVWSVGRCDVCGDATAVTSPQEYGSPRFEGFEDESG